MRALLLLALSAGTVFGCSCVGEGTVCGKAEISPVVFVGRVIVDSGERFGTRPARVVVEESIKNAPPVRTEVEINSGFGTSCHTRLEAGRRYVIFTKGSAQSRRFSVNACSHPLMLEDNEHELDAIRNQTQGGPARIVGTVWETVGKTRVSGATVTLTTGDQEFRVMADEKGHYEVKDLKAGRYRFSVSKEGYRPNGVYNERWSGRLVINPQTRRVEPDRDLGTVVVGDTSCAVWDLALTVPISTQP